MATIAYDLPVRDLIAGLDATEHVTHTQHRKTKVTLHHNGGRLSHDGVLSVWQTRPASAHFDLDSIGALAQYVRVNEYAWATGNTIGNQESISIEMCNLTLAPDWIVGEATWRGAARLAGWLFARVIGERPHSGNLVMHSYWSSTDCAGPYVRGIYGRILAEAQNWYDTFTGENMPLTQADADLVVTTMMNRFLEDKRDKKPDGVHDTTFGNAVWSTWHTIHFGDPVNGMYPSTKQILNAVEKSTGIKLTPEAMTSINEAITKAMSSIASSAFQAALQNTEGKIGFVSKSSV